MERLQEEQWYRDPGKTKKIINLSSRRRSSPGLIPARQDLCRSRMLFLHLRIRTRPGLFSPRSITRRRLIKGD